MISQSRKKNKKIKAELEIRSEKNYKLRLCKLYNWNKWKRISGAVFFVCHDDDVTTKH